MTEPSSENSPASLVSLYTSWVKSDEMTIFLSYLRRQHPSSTDLEITNHALHFSLTHMVAFLVTDDDDEDPDKPSWM